MDKVKIKHCRLCGCAMVGGVPEALAKAALVAVLRKRGELK